MNKCTRIPVDYISSAMPPRNWPHQNLEIVKPTRAAKPATAEANMKSWQRKASGPPLAIVLLSSFVVGCSSQSTPTQPLATALATNANPILGNPEAAEDQEPLTRLAPLPPNTSTSLVEVVKLIQGGMDESVILAYIDRCPTAFEPTVDEILYLNDLGVSAKLISALIRHGEIVGEGLGLAATNIVVEPMADNQPPATANPAASQYVAQPAEGEVAAGPAVVQQTQPTIVTAPPPAMPPQASVFYNDLASYGSWMELDGYGWCWQPTTVVVNPSWQPYADQGRWLYTDSGWYWQSDYSWGWAPFHYGRWLSHRRCGWVWVPDTVWGPSWVSWRQTPSYCGWAPLPPSCHYVPHYGFTFGGHRVDNDCDFGLSVNLFSFIHWRHFNDRNPHGYYVPRGQTAAIYSHSKVVNNYVTGSHNTVINDGVNWDRLAAYRPAKLRPISVRELSPEAGTLLKPDRVQKKGQSLVIYRPQLQTATPPAVTLKGPRTPDSPATRSPMSPPAGQALAASSRNNDLLAGRTVPPRSSLERSTPLAAPSAVGRNSVRPSTSNPRSQTTVSRSTYQGITIGRSSDNRRRSSIGTPPAANSTPPPAPPPSRTWRTPAPPMSSSSYSVTPPSRNEFSRPSASSFTPPKTGTRVPPIASQQRTVTSSPTKPFSSTYTPAPRWTPPAISSPAPRQSLPAPYSRPTPNYNSAPRPPSYSSPARAPMSAPSVSRSPDPAPSRTPSPSSSRDSSSDSRRDSGNRR